MTTIADIRANSNPNTFPVERLNGCWDALAFYCAAYLGAQDVINLIDAGLNVVGVDTDAERLIEMDGAYRERGALFSAMHWDALKYARRMGVAKKSCVTADPYSGAEMARVFDNLGAFANCARRVLIVGVSAEWLKAHETDGSAPDDVLRPWSATQGWSKNFVFQGTYRRSAYAGGQWWAVWERRR